MLEQLCQKDTPTQGFSCEYSELNHSSFFIEHLRWLLLNIYIGPLTLFSNFALFKGNAQYDQNTTFGLSEKMIAQLRKMLCKIPMNTRATISVMLLC